MGQETPSTVDHRRAKLDFERNPNRNPVSGARWEGQTLAFTSPERLVSDSPIENLLKLNRQIVSTEGIEPALKEWAKANSDAISQDLALLELWQARSGRSVEWLFRWLNTWVTEDERKARAAEGAAKVLAREISLENRGKIKCPGKMLNDKGKKFRDCPAYLNPWAVSPRDNAVVCYVCGERVVVNTVKAK